MRHRRFHLDFQSPRGPEAARLRQRRRGALRRHQALTAVLEDMLPGSLSLSHFRCGKPTCHCARGEVHPAWSLTYMTEGRKQVQHIPIAWVEAIRRRVEAGRAFQDAVREVLAANAELLKLTRRQRRR